MQTPQHIQKVHSQQILGLMVKLKIIKLLEGNFVLCKHFLERTPIIRGHKSKLGEIVKQYDRSHDPALLSHTSVLRNFTFSSQNWQQSICPSTTERINNCRIFLWWVSDKQEEHMRCWYDGWISYYIERSKKSAISLLNSRRSN